MSKDDIILMADASGLSYYGMGKDRDKFVHYLKAFAALVAAAERDKYEVQFKKLMQLHEVRESQPNKPCCLVEREACAKLIGESNWIGPKAKQAISAAIRARGENT